MRICGRKLDRQTGALLGAAGRDTDTHYPVYDYPDVALAFFLRLNRIGAAQIRLILTHTFVRVMFSFINASHKCVSHPEANLN